MTTFDVETPVPVSQPPKDPAAILCQLKHIAEEIESSGAVLLQSVEELEGALSEGKSLSFDDRTTIWAIGSDLGGLSKSLLKHLSALDEASNCAKP